MKVTPYADTKLPKAQDEGSKVKAEQEKGVKIMQGLRGPGYFSDWFTYNLKTTGLIFACALIYVDYRIPC